MIIIHISFFILQYIPINYQHLLLDQIICQKCLPAQYSEAIAARSPAPSHGAGAAGRHDNYIVMDMSAVTTIGGEWNSDMTASVTNIIIQNTRIERNQSRFKHTSALYY